MNKILTALILILVFSSQKAWAKSYRVGVEDIEYYPHSAVIDGKYQGFARDVLDAFAKSKGYTFKYVPMPYARNARALFNSKIDFQYPDNSYWLADVKKGRNIIYSDSVITYTDGLHILPSNRHMKVSEISVIGTLIDFYPVHYLALEKKGKLKINYAATVTGLIKQVHLGRTDGVYLNTDVVKYHERNSKNPIEFNLALPHITSGYSLATINHKKIIVEFNKFLKDNKLLLVKIKKRYGIDLDGFK